MEIYLKENLKMLREDKGLSQLAFAEQLSIKKNTYGNYETGYSNPDFYVLKRISQYFGYSVDELLYTLLEKHTDDKTPGNERREEIYSHTYQTKKPNVYDMDCKSANAICTYITDNDQLESLPKFYHPRLGPGLHVRIQITGDSMHSTIKNNDFVLAKHVPHILQDIREGSIYVVVDKDDGIICKRIYKHSDSSLEMVSDNKTFKPYIRNVNDIVAIFKLEQVHSSDLNNYNNVNDLISIWKNIDELNKRVYG